MLPGHALAIGVTSYDGSVFYGITADRDALPDVDVLAQCLTEALDELVDTVTTRPRAPRGRRKRKKAGLDAPIDGKSTRIQAKRIEGNGKARAPRAAKKATTAPSAEA